MRLGVFTAKEGAMRTGNVCLRPEHDFWKLKTFEEVKEHFVKSFPQIDFSTFVTDEELARFAAATPGEFPTPQYAKGIQQMFTHVKAGMAEYWERDANVVVIAYCLSHCITPYPIA
jgi:hypothetical protein